MLPRLVACCLLTAVFAIQRHDSANCPALQVTDSTDYLAESDTTILQGSKAATNNVVLHNVTRDYANVHILWLSSTKDLENICKLALTATDAILVYVDSLQFDMPLLHVLFKVGTTDRA